MLRAILLLLITILINCSSVGAYGKSSTSAYLKNRLLDAADIFSFTLVFNTYGAKVAASSTGLGLHMDGFPAAVMIPTSEAGLRFGVIDNFECRGLTPIITYWEDCKSGTERLAMARNKEISTENPQNKNKAVYTRLGIAAGFIVGFKAEFNPGELADFILGFAGIDFYGDDIIIKDKREANLVRFLEAAEDGDFNKAKNEIEQGLDVNTIDYGFSGGNDKSSLLMVAIKYNQTELAKYLINKGANPNLKNQENQNAFSFSFIKMQPDLALYMLSNSKITPEKESLNEALPEAVKLRDLKMAELLINKGADTNYNDGLAILAAIESRSDKILDLILKTKPRLDYQNPRDAVFSDHKKSLLGSAYYKGYLSGFIKLLEAGANPDQTEGDYKTILMHTAGSCDSIEYVKALLKKGANKNTLYAGTKKAYDFIDSTDSNEKCMEMKKLLK